MSSVYEKVTGLIIAQLDAGTVPWRKTWRGGEAGMPRNLVSKRAYRGINRFLLAMQGYESPCWLTFRQAKQLGGRVRKGSKGTPVVFWKFPSDEERAHKKKTPIVAHYTVFHSSQVDGVEDPWAEVDPEFQFSPLTEAAALAGDLRDCAQVIYDGFEPRYNPVLDVIYMPRPHAFESTSEYFSTLFHEAVHSTGHRKRLARPSVTNPQEYGSHAYSKEELVAEIGSSMLCGLAGIEGQTITNQAAYIQGWLKVMQGDSKLVIHAAQAAQHAVDWLVGEERQLQEAA